MMPTLALPGEVAPGQLGPISRAPARVDLGHDLEHVERGDVLRDAEDGADARRRAASRMASGAPAAGT